MAKFIQLHLLTSYPPSNLNRDDLGRPKTAMMGDVQRLRISSQCLKRSWRKSDLFKEALSRHLGERTKRKGLELFDALKTEGVDEKKAKEWAQQIAKVFGKCEESEKDKPLKDLGIKQLAHFSPEEKAAIDALVKKLVKGRKEPTEEDLKLLREKHKAVDIAMFGRMLADVPKYNTEAAVQVAHAITVHKVAVEDDYFIAVDDINAGNEDKGAAR